MLSIKVRSPKYNADLEIEDKLTIIQGDSGTGKTVFTKGLSNKYFKYTVSSDYKLLVLDERTLELASSKDIKTNKYIYIIDEEYFIFKQEFYTFFNNDKSSYFIVINRFRMKGLDSLSGLSFSIKSVYNFVKEGKNHYIQRAFDYKREITNKIDKCIIEDTRSGFQFFSNIFSNIESYDGKDNLPAYLYKNKNYIKKNIFLIIDLCACGNRFDLLYDYMITQNIKLTLDPNYESFEYFLLRSNFYKFDFNSLSLKDIAMFKSREVLYIEILDSVSAKAPYSYNKASLSNCYLVDCCCMSNNQKRSFCERGLSGNKIKAMLIGTEFEYLLDFMSDNTK